ERQGKCKHPENGTVKIQRPRMPVHFRDETLDVVIDEELLDKPVPVHPGASDVPGRGDSEGHPQAFGMPGLRFCEPSPRKAESQQRCRWKPDRNRPLRQQAQSKTGVESIKPPAPKQTAFV